MSVQTVHVTWKNQDGLDKPVFPGEQFEAYINSHQHNLSDMQIYKCTYHMCICVLHMYMYMYCVHKAMYSTYYHPTKFLYTTKFYIYNTLDCSTFFAKTDRGLFPARSWNHDCAISFRFLPRGTGKKLSFVTGSFLLWLSCNHPFLLLASKTWLTRVEYWCRER